MLWTIKFVSTKCQWKRKLNVLKDRNGKRVWAEHQAWDWHFFSLLCCWVTVKNFLGWIFFFIVLLHPYPARDRDCLFKPTVWCLEKRGCKSCRMSVCSWSKVMAIQSPHKRVWNVLLSHRVGGKTAEEGQGWNWEGDLGASQGGNGTGHCLEHYWRKRDGHSGTCPGQGQLSRVLKWWPVLFLYLKTPKSFMVSSVQPFGGPRLCLWLLPDT